MPSNHADVAIIRTIRQSVTVLAQVCFVDSLTHSLTHSLFKGFTMSQLVKNVRSIAFDFATIASPETTTVNLSRLLADGDSNTKLRKSSGAQYLTAGLSMSPQFAQWKTFSKTSDSWHGIIVDQAMRHLDGITAVNSCPMASAGCAGACLNHQGLASVWDTIIRSRIMRTICFHEFRQWFLDRLALELERWERKAKKQEKKLCVRLNVLQDIPWEKFGIVDRFPGIQFYDYTAIPNRAGLLRPNYWVTLSRKENNDSAVLKALSAAKNVAVVFADVSGSFTGNRSHLQQTTENWNGFKVVDGDITDLRFDDPRGRKYGRVVGVRLKTHSKLERESALASGFPIKVLNGRIVE